MNRRLFTLLTTGALVAGLLPLANVLVVSAASPTAAATISKHDRELIATARVNGQTTVTLLVAAKPGQNAAAAKAIAALGGSVGYREDSINYLRVTVGIDQVAAV